MQELEKILEEIEQKKENCLNVVKIEIDTMEITIHRERYKGLCMAEEIIRKHINDGWIPVEERLPEAPEMEDEYPEFNVMIEGAKIPTTLQYSYDGVWIDDYGNVYNVIAWRPLPESYIPRNQNKPEDHYPDWRTKLLNKFDRRE